MNRSTLVAMMITLGLYGCAPAQPPATGTGSMIRQSPSSSLPSSPMPTPKNPAGSSCSANGCGQPMSDAEARRILTPEQYEILRQKGTEAPFTSPLLTEHRKGTFVAADTGEPLFRSEAKFESGTGWPSFFEPISPDAIVEKEDDTFGMRRTEVLTKEGSHLGHVFPDGPNPTGLRYCINGAALKFVPDPN